MYITIMILFLDLPYNNRNNRIRKFIKSNTRRCFMMVMKSGNKVQTFIRTVIRLVIIVPLFLLLVYPDFQKIGDIVYGGEGDFVLQSASALLKTILILLIFR